MNQTTTPEGTLTTIATTLEGRQMQALSVELADWLKVCQQQRRRHAKATR